MNTDHNDSLFCAVGSLIIGMRLSASELQPLCLLLSLSVSLHSYYGVWGLIPPYCRENSRVFKTKAVESWHHSLCFDFLKLGPHIRM